MYTIYNVNVQRKLVLSLHSIKYNNIIGSQRELSITIMPCNQDIRQCIKKFVCHILRVDIRITPYPKKYHTRAPSPEKLGYHLDFRASCYFFKFFLSVFLNTTSPSPNLPTECNLNPKLKNT